MQRADGAVARERQWSSAAALAWRDLLDEWRVSLCLVFALAAVLAPLLVLFGLKSGIVSTMTERLKADPVNRELVIRGHHVLPPTWFETLAASPRVGFVVPKTRFLSATITLETADGAALQDLDMLPTAVGDPLLPPGTAPPAGVNQILLSHTAATALRAHTGMALQGVIARRREDRAETVRIPLQVVGVLPETAVGRDAALVPLQLLIAAEDYRDGLISAELGAQAGAAVPPGARAFASARLYARGLEDVAPLAEQLRAQAIEVVTRAREIETVQAIDRVLTLVFVVLAGIAVGGFLVSLAASLWANVDRKRREIALLRLIGLRSGPVIGFPAVQALLVALAGTAISLLIYAVVSIAFNRAFATYLGREEFVCALQPRHAAIAAALTLVFALTASVVGGYRATRIDPAESLREP